MSKRKEDSYKVEGTVYEIFPQKDFESGFYKREFVLEVNNEGKDGAIYKDFLKFEAVKSFVSNVDILSKGDEVEVTFTVGGRRWETPEKQEKIIMYLRCWGVRVLNKYGGSASPPASSDTQPEDFDLNIDGDALPF